jgi:hypothetical protein
MGQIDSEGVTKCHGREIGVSPQVFTRAQTRGMPCCYPQIKPCREDGQERNFAPPVFPTAGFFAAFVVRPARVPLNRQDQAADESRGTELKAPDFAKGIAAIGVRWELVCTLLQALQQTDDLFQLAHLSWISSRHFSSSIKLRNGARCLRNDDA